MWNTDQEKLLQHWGEQCKGLSWVHSHSAKKYKKLNDYTSISGIVFSGVAGAGTFVNIHCDTYVAIIVGCIAIASAISSGVNKYLNYQQTSNLHRESSYKFQGLASEIEYQLATSRQYRTDSIKFIQECKELYDSLRGESPNVPDDIIKQFNNKFGESDIAKPEIANGISSITIRKISHDSTESNNPIIESTNKNKEGISTEQLKSIVLKWKKEPKLNKTHPVSNIDICDNN